VTIRPAEAADVHALSALAKRTWSAAFGDSVEPEDGEAELEDGRSDAYFLEALATKTILVAEADDILVGYVQFGDVGVPEVEPGPGDRGLHRLYVDSAHQGRGLGRMLLEAALRHPRLAEAGRIFLQVWEENPEPSAFTKASASVGSGRRGSRSATSRWRISSSCWSEAAAKGAS
jgi:ribosomal protein S18 acetylase RimI-like enzyme